MKRPFFLTLCLLTVLISCGGDKDSDDEEAQQEEDTTQETEGSYRADLVPLNTSVAGSTVGSFKIRIFGDEFRVRADVENSPNTFHPQFIHTGHNCPGPGADTNIDGVVSFNESIAITGDAIIPLDNNLSTQKAGGIYPVAGAMGGYTYFEITSLVKMLSDLRLADPDPNDALTKLGADEPLNLVGKTIVVYGIPGNKNMPIACGKIVRTVEPLPDNNPPPQPEHRPPPPTHRPPPPPIIPFDDSFSTLLYPGLFIEGDKCMGGERTNDNWVCFKNQWLVSINEETFIANLVLVRDISTSTTAYYNIRPVSPVDNETLRLANEHWVKFVKDDAPVVLRKPNR
jgi:hypothetical protein